METAQFDALVKAFADAASRRRLLGRAASLTLGGAVAALLGETGEAAKRRSQRNQRNRQQVDAARKKRKKCARAGQTTSKKRKKCCAGLVKNASGVCAAPSPPGCTGLKPTNTSATKGLQEAIDATPLGGTLTLCAGTWNLTSTVVIKKTLNLIGAGAGQTILDGGNAVRVLQIMVGKTATVHALTITKGFGTGTLNDSGGGIFNEGDLTLVGVAVTGNKASSGGGIENVTEFAKLTLEAGTSVSGNTATTGFGGGIDNFNLATVTLEAGSSVSDNTAELGAGGISNEDGGVVTLQANSSVTGNTVTQATGTGGGIFNSNDGAVILHANSRVTGNSAATGGGITNGGGGSPFVTVDPGAFVCSNNPPAHTNQCEGTIANCPSPSATCP